MYLKIKKIVDMNNLKKTHCEITGFETSIENTVALVKIDGVIALKNLDKPIIDFEKKIIYSKGKKPVNFYSEVFVPKDLKQIFGKIFSIVNDVDDIEQSTAVMSNDGQDLFSGQKLFAFMKDINDGIQIINIPSTLFFPVIDSETKLVSKQCENWDINYSGLHGKYRYKKIIKENREQFIPGVLMPGYDIAVSDRSDLNPNGKDYHFKTDSKFNSLDVCCNESAVSFCEKNFTIVYYNDFINNGKLRILIPETVKLNLNLQNAYLYRSLNF